MPLTLKERCELSIALTDFRNSEGKPADWAKIETAISSLLEARVDGPTEDEIAEQKAAELAREDCRCREDVGDNDDCPVHGVPPSALAALLRDFPQARVLCTCKGMWRNTDCPKHGKGGSEEAATLGEMAVDG